jgi:hypothetical protein
MDTEIIIPDNFEIDKIDGNKIILKEKSKLPKTWEECLNVYKYVEDLVYIDNDSEIMVMSKKPENDFKNHNLIPDCFGKSMLSLCQLLVCRNAYWKIDNDWRPDGTKPKEFYFIYTSNRNTINLNWGEWSNHILVFRTAEIRDEFYNNFKDLIEQAKELL